MSDHLPRQVYRRLVAQGGQPRYIDAEDDILDWFEDRLEFFLKNFPWLTEWADPATGARYRLSINFTLSLKRIEPEEDHGRKEENTKAAGAAIEEPKARGASGRDEQEVRGGGAREEGGRVRLSAHAPPDSLGPPES